MPLTVHPVDTMPAPAAAENFTPQYKDGFPVAQAGDTTLGSINHLPVMEVPPPSEAQQFVRSPLHDTPSMLLLIAGLLSVALCYHTGYKYIENFFHYMFSTRRRENLFEDHTVNETSILAALIANTCIVEGFIIYFAVQLLCPQFAVSLQTNIFPHIAVFCGLCVAFYVIQWIVYHLIGFTFSDKAGTKLWIDGFKSSQAFLGLTLLPILIMLMLYTSSGKLLLTIAAALYLASRPIFVFKGFRIFYGNLSSCVYFILYLCAVEIVPLLVMASVTIWLCGILQ